MALIDPIAIPKLLDMNHLKKDEVTNLFYQYLDGSEKQVVIKKQVGRPRKEARHKAEWHPEEKRIEACTLFAATGSITKTAALCKVPAGTVRRWKDEDWWDEISQRIRREENESTDKKFSTIVDKALSKIEERIENGDYVYDIKKGVAVPVPVGARDLAIVTGTLFDKRQLLRGEATKISKNVNTEEHLNQLAERFIQAVKKRGSGVKELDIEDAQTIQGESVLLSEEDVGASGVAQEDVGVLAQGELF